MSCLECEHVPITSISNQGLTVPPRTLISRIRLSASFAKSHTTAWLLIHAKKSCECSSECCCIVNIYFTTGQEMLFELGVICDFVKGCLGSKAIIHAVAWSPTSKSRYFELVEVILVTKHVVMQARAYLYFNK